MDIRAAYGGRSAAEVLFPATVASSPHYFVGSRTHAMHEAFVANSSAGPVEIVDNVGLAPRVPVNAGDSILVKGEMVHDKGRIPVVHWTHHDPSEHHEDGFIQFRGRVYA
ncbi:MAG: DUF3465 domain-containing protein [Candidatus Eremiobacteraeota bacterium]|nr:DUF3465 domain-containing protein [Candidatus Eremiobacteraeota bacterium]